MSQRNIVVPPRKTVWAALLIILSALTATAQPSLNFTTYPGVTGLFGSHIFFGGGIATGPDGALWVSARNSTRNEIWRVTTAGTITEFPISNAPGTIAAGPDGALWFTEPSARQIGRITTSGAVAEYSIPCCATPSGIVAGPDGSLWFTENGGGDKIGRITTTGWVAEYPLPNPNFLSYGITAGPDGALWFVDGCGPGADKIGRVTTAGAITEYDLPDSCGPTLAPVAGSDGALWYLVGIPGAVGRITTAGSITEYPLPFNGLFPFNIVAGPDGALWFLVTDPDGYSPPALGRMSTSGVFTQSGLPVALSAGGSVMALGPDNALWITDGSTIVRAAIGPRESQLAITTTSLPAGVGGTAYSASVTASGGNPPYTWSIISGRLPAGLSLNSATGAISGVPIAPGTNFTVRVTDSSLPAQSAMQALSIFVSNPMSVFTIGSSPSGLAIAVDGVSYTTPNSFLCDAGTQRTLAVISPQPIPGISGGRYSFTGWSDGVASLSRQITCPSTATTYTARFNAQYLLTIAVEPVGVGSVAASPASSDGFYNTGTAVQLTASGNFLSWSGDLSGSANPQSVTMNGPKSVTANFASAIAQISSPAAGSQLASTTVTFTWSAAAGADGYWLDVGTVLAQGNICASGQITATSFTCSGIPTTGSVSTIYVQLWTHANGVWLSPQRYTYSPPPGASAAAQITSPTPGTQLSSTTMTFSWNTAVGADSYWLDVGTVLAQGNICASGQITPTSFTCSGIPTTGSVSTIYVQLWTHANGVWLSPQRYTYSPPPGASAAAQIMSPTPGTQLSSTTMTFSWNTAVGADSYWLDVGTVLAQGNICASGQITPTSFTCSGIPTTGSVSTIYVQLWTHANGVWLSPQRYTYSPPSGL